MYEATQDSASLWPAVVVGVYWAYMLLWRELQKQSGKSIWPGTDPAAAASPALVRKPSASPSGAAGTGAAFDAEQFLQEACNAYEFILRNYTEGNLESLVGLLDREVLESFSLEAERLAAEGRRIRLQFVALEKPEIVDTVIEEATAAVSVRFKSEMFKEERATGEVAQSTLIHAVDLWTFRRQHDSESPVWVLVATDTPH